jgi:hypothetical protein
MATHAYTTTTSIADDFASRPPPIDVSDLKLGQLLTLFIAFQSAQEGFEAIANQPRGNKVEEILQQEIERCGREMHNIAEQAGLRCPIAQFDRQAKGEILVRWNLECGGFTDLLVAAREHFGEARS